MGVDRGGDRGREPHLDQPRPGGGLGEPQLGEGQVVGVEVAGDVGLEVARRVGHVTGREAHLPGLEVNDRRTAGRGDRLEADRGLDEAPLVGERDRKLAHVLVREVRRRRAQDGEGDEYGHASDSLSSGGVGAPDQVS